MELLAGFRNSHNADHGESDRLSKITGVIVIRQSDHGFLSCY